MFHVLAFRPELYPSLRGKVQPLQKFTFYWITGGALVATMSSHAISKDMQKQLAGMQGVFIFVPSLFWT